MAKKKNPKLPATALPDYLDSDAWQGWLDMRKAIKKPITPRAAQLALNKIADWHAGGYDVNEIVDQNTLNAWQGMWLPRDAQPKHAEVNYANSQQTNPRYESHFERHSRLQREERDDLQRQFAGYGTVN